MLNLEEIRTRACFIIKRDNLITVDGRVNHKRFKSLKSYDLICFNSLKEYYSIDDTNELFFLIINSIDSVPLCPVCNKKTKFLKGAGGRYQMYCSLKCSNKSEQVKAKKKESFINKYGSHSPFQIDDIKETIKRKNLLKFGHENPFGSDIIKDKIKRTNLRKYGKEHPAHTEKAKQTCIERYGVDNPCKSNIILDRLKCSNRDRFGADFFMGTADFKAKAHKTIKDRYNVDHVSQIEAVKEKSIKTSRTKYFNLFTLKLEKKLIDVCFCLNDFVNKKKNESLRYKCKRCNSFFDSIETNPQNIHCSCTSVGMYYFSQQEKEIAKWLKEFVSNIKENDRTVLTPLELDIYIPEHKLAIEYNGLYWHCELNKDKDYHLNKTLKCKEKGIQLIHIFENEWLFKQEIVKSIIKAKLGLFDERIYARKCEIQEIGQDRYNEFLEKNHLQGKSIAKVRLGLYHNDELVSVMGFGKSRFKKDEIELIRFANKLNTSIVGGFSRLLKYYIINFKPDNLVSYCDLRYFDGSGYLKNGFEVIGKSLPNYFYMKDRHLNLYSRMQFQKHKLKDKLDIYDETLTEHENMLNNKYYRIYDCGNLKLEYGKICKGK